VLPLCCVATVVCCHCYYGKPLWQDLCVLPLCCVATALCCCCHCGKPLWQDVCVLPLCCHCVATVLPLCCVATDIVAGHCGKTCACCHCVATVLCCHCVATVGRLVRVCGMARSYMRRDSSIWVIESDGGAVIYETCYIYVHASLYIYLYI